MNADRNSSDELEGEAPRNSVRAVIIDQGHVLVLRKLGGSCGPGESFALPGGGQEPGETLLEALHRECLEEIGAQIRAQGLLGVGDFFKPREEEPHRPRQQVEFLFHCELPNGYEPANGHRPDSHQVDVCWLALEALDSVSFYNRDIAALLAHSGDDLTGGYLGLLS